METYKPRGAAMSRSFEYVFPAIRGIQGGREYFVSMCPLRLIPKIFVFNEVELQPELRAQRHLNKSRLPEIARYIIDNPKDYVFSAITASIDSKVRFQALGSADQMDQVGTLHIPMEARFVINDGQHRRAAIEMALAERPDLADETIAVVFFLDRGLKRCQQMFADLNRHAIRPSRSIGVLYDHRDDMAELSRVLISRSPLFKNLTEMEKSTLSARSRKLFTLSAIYTGTLALLQDSNLPMGDERAERALSFWTEVSEQFPEWHSVQAGKLTAGEVRQDFLHSHGVALQALGRVGKTLFEVDEKKWRNRIKSLRRIDWRRSNVSLWEGRAMVGGRISKSQQHVMLTTNAIKLALKLSLSEDEKAAEKTFVGGRNAAAA